MTCPDCGFSQTRGDTCVQCGNPFPNSSSSSEGGFSEASTSTVFPKKPTKEKTRSRPLHDLDLTISMPGLSDEKPEIKDGSIKKPLGPAGSKPSSLQNPVKPEESRESKKDPLKGKTASKEESPRKKTDLSVLPEAVARTSSQKLSHRERHLSTPDLKNLKNKPVSSEPVTYSESSKKIITSTTTSNIEGYRISTYLGIVSSVVLLKGKHLQAFSVKVKDLQGALGTPFDSKIKDAHQTAQENLSSETIALRGNAVVGITINTVLGPEGLWIFYNGTAVEAKKE